MVRITTFTLCDSVNTQHGPQGQQTTQLVEPRIVLRPMFIPGNYSFGISIGVQGVNLHQQNRVSFQIFAPNGDIVQNSGTTDIPAFGQKDTLPPEFQGLVLNLDIRNLIVKEEGIYKLILYINEEPLAAQQIPIFRGVENE